MDYRTGYDYLGSTFVTARATGSANSTGSEFCWANPGINLISLPNYPDVYKTVYQKLLWGGYTRGRQIDDPYMCWYVPKGSTQLTKTLPFYIIMAKNYFTSPGGGWGIGGGPSNQYETPELVGEYLPQLYRGVYHTDGPALPFQGYGFEAWPLSVGGNSWYLWANQITLVNNFDSWNNMKAVSYTHLTLPTN